MTPQTPAAETLSNGPAPRAPHHHRALAVGLAAGVLGTTLVGGGLALAASPHTTAATATPAAGQTAAPKAAKGTAGTARTAKAHHRHGLASALGRVVHGEGVVKTKTGYETVDVARGVFTVTGSTVTVKSADGVVSPAFTISPATHVRAAKKAATSSAVTTGATGEIVGVKSATGIAAKMVVVK